MANETLHFLLVVLGSYRPRARKVIAALADLKFVLLTQYHQVTCVYPISGELAQIPSYRALQPLQVQT